MYLATVVIGSIALSFMLVDLKSVRHNSPLFHSEERANVERTPGVKLRSTALTHPDIPPN